MRWFRFYNETRHDPKVQRLPAELFRAWVNLLCYANENGGAIPGTPDDLAYEMRMPVSRAMKCIEQLKHAGLLDQDETLHPHNWNGRQYQSDDVGTRVKRYRERQRNVTETASETPPDTDSDTEQSRTEVNSALSAPMETPTDGKSKRGTRLAANWEPDLEDRTFAEQLGLDADSQAAEFRDYWCGVPGAKGCKLDWPATWRNRCRDVAAKRRQLAGGRGRMVNRQGPNSLVAAVRQAVADAEGQP
jgi:hypothetical protein